MTTTPPQSAPEPPDRDDARKPRGLRQYLINGGAAIAVLIALGLFATRGAAAFPSVMVVAVTYFVCWMILSSGGLRALVIALAVALPFRWGVGEPYKIPSGSMEPTLHGDERPFRGDRVFVNKFVYGWRWPFDRSRVPVLGTIVDYADGRIWNGADPQRFDIVVFKSPEEDPRNMTLIKRVIGLPGERVNIHDGKIHIDGEPIEMPPDLADSYYTRPASYSEPAHFGLSVEDVYAVVPEGHYFLLGDNSSNSRDGRYWGWAPDDHILGRAVCIWWPPSRMRDFTGFTESWSWRLSVAAIAGLLFWRIFLGRTWRAGKHPMIDAVAPKERLYIDRIAAGLDEPITGTRLFARMPKRGEALLYVVPTDNRDEYEVHMGWAVALPGEEVTIRDDGVHINGAPLDGALRGHAFGAPADGAVYGMTSDPEHRAVPAGHVFVLSDVSGAPDSRTLGWIANDQIAGVIRFVWWPLHRWRRVRP